MKIQITLEQLQELLDEQKKLTGDYITRNLSMYDWFHDNPSTDINLAKLQLKNECLKSPNPNDADVLKKYLKP